MDDEEQRVADQAIDRSGLASAVRSIESEGGSIDDPTRSQMEDNIEIEALGSLLDLARNRLDEADFAGAANTCVKVLGLSGTLHEQTLFSRQEVWWLLAEINAGYGDLPRAETALASATSEVNEAMARIRRRGIESDPSAKASADHWSERESEVIGLIERKRTAQSP